MARRPVPLEVKQGKGTARVGREAKTPPARVAGLVKAPEGMSGHALTCWAEMADLLTKRGQLTLDSRPSLVRLCQTYAECVELEKVISEEGRFQDVKTGSGDSMKRAHPALAALADADRRFKGWLIEFGLTDASRGKVNALAIRQPTARKGKSKAGAKVEAPGSRFGLN
jgi:P27 family predicted phage terminase small subunit